QSAAVATVMLRDGQTSHIDLQIPSGRITGIVADAATGAALDSAAVYAPSDAAGCESRLELAMRRAATTRTDGSGAFTLKNLRGGVHRVIAGGTDFMASGALAHALVATTRGVGAARG